MDNGDFFSQDEIVEITGLRKPAAQEKLLRSWGLVVSRNAMNEVRLMRHALAMHQSGQARAHTMDEPEPQLVL